MNHYPYFEGLGFAAFPTKTVKTMCDRRVAPSSAKMRERVGCPACRAILEKRVADAKHIAVEVRAGAQGFSLSAECDTRLLAACDGDVVWIGEVLTR